MVLRSFVYFSRSYQRMFRSEADMCQREWLSLGAKQNERLA